MTALALALLATLSTSPLARAQDEPPPHHALEAGVGIIVRMCADERGEALYLAGDGHVRKLAVADGAPLWDVELKVPIPIDGLDLAEDRLYLSLSSAAYQWIDAEAGGELRPGIGGPNAMQVSTCLVADPKDRWVWIGTKEGVVTRLTPGDVNGWSTRGMKNGAVTCMARDARARTLAVGGQDGSVRFLDTSSAKRDEKKVLEHGAAVTAVVFDPRGATVASGGEDGVVRTWKVSNGKALEELPLAEGEGARAVPVRSLAVDPKGKWLAAGGADGRVRVFDLKKGERLATFGPEDGGAVGGLVFVGKGKELAAAHGKALVVWDLSGF